MFETAEFYAKKHVRNGGATSNPKAPKKEVDATDIILTGFLLAFGAGLFQLAAHIGKKLTKAEAEVKVEEEEEAA